MFREWGNLMLGGSRIKLKRIRRPNKFGRRCVPRRVAILLIVLVAVVTGIVWYQVAGVSALTTDLINSTFETDGASWNTADSGNTGVTISTSDNTYNHTTSGDRSAMVSIPQGNNTGVGTIKRSFTTPKGLVNDSVNLSLWYRNDAATTLNLTWEIRDASDTTSVVASTAIVNTSVYRGWTQYNTSTPISGLNADTSYLLRLKVDAQSNSDTNLNVNWDDILLTANYNPVPTTVVLSASKTSIPNNNITETTLTATITDQNDNLMENQPVNFTKNQFWGAFSATSVNTGSDGKAAVDFTSDTGGNITVTATAGSASQDILLTVLRPEVVTVSRTLSTMPNDGTTSSITAHVLDQNSQPLQGVRVDFTKSSISGVLAPAFDMTDVDGDAHTTFSSNVGDSYTITATSGGKTGNNTVIVQSPTVLTNNTSKNVIPNDNNTSARITAHLIDQDNNPMAGETITFSVDKSGGTFSAGSAITDAAGNAWVDFKSGVLNGDNFSIISKVMRVTPNVTSPALKVKVQAPKSLTMQIFPDVIPNDNTTSSTITATLLDQEDIVISGESIDFTTNLGVFTSTGTNTANELITDSTGRVVVSLRSGSNGVASVTGTVHRFSSVSGSALVTVEVPVSTDVVLVTSKSMIPGDNNTTTTVTATVYDQNSFVIPGRTVTFTKSPENFGEFVSNTTETTDANGQTSVTFKSDHPGTFNITGTCEGKSGNTEVIVIPLTPNILTVSVSANRIPNDGITTTSVTAHLIDQYGHPFGGQTVFFSKNQTWGLLSAYNAITDSNGNAYTTYRTLSSGPVTITAISGIASGQKIVEVEKRVPAHLTLTASADSILADGLEKSTITAYLIDQFSAPMLGEQINFSAGFGNLSVTRAITDSNGNATVKIRSSLPGMVSVTGSANSAPIITGVATVELSNADIVPPTLVKAEATSKQVFYLTFSENIKLNPYIPVGWTLKKYVGATATDVPFVTPTILPSDPRVIKITLDDGTLMGKGNQYPDPIRYEISVNGIYDLNNNAIAGNTVISVDAFTPHGKYAPFPVAAGNSTRVCAQCHVTHSAVGQKLLNRNTVQKVCFVCHGIIGSSEYKVQSEFYRGDGGSYSPSMHKALDLDSPGYNLLTCVDCHTAHGTRRPGTNDIEPKLLQAKVSGGIVTSGDGNWFCLACHGDGDANSLYGNRLGNYWDNTFGDHSDGMTLVDEIRNEVAVNVYNSAHYDNNFDELIPESGTNITCLKCHERHGSGVTGLIDDTTLDSSESQTEKNLCYKCHNSTDNSLNKIDIKSKFEPAGGIGSKHLIADSTGLACRSCHEPHSVAQRSFADSNSTKPSDISNPDNTKNNWNKTSGSLSDFCIKCHDGVPPNVEIDPIAKILRPFSITFPNTTFSNGTGWNKTDYTSSGHYSRNIECDKCHDPHGSDNDRLTVLPEDPSGSPTQDGMCLRCHGAIDGESPSGPDVYSGGFDQPFTHPTLDQAKDGVHKDTEDISSVARHAECYDCHDQHTATDGAGEVDKLGKVAGIIFSETAWVSWDSAVATKVALDPNTNNRQAYLCYKCHSKYAYTTPPSGQTDVAQEFNPANQARHVVEGDSSMRPGYGSFVNPWNTASTLRCTDCHGSHGAAEQHILKKPFDNTTGTIGSTSSHLCFSCHDFDYYTGASSSSVESKFSGGGNSNLHKSLLGSHGKAGCVACHGAVPHGWKRTDSEGKGLPLVTAADPEQYSSGAKIDSLSGTNDIPGAWQQISCSTVAGCHN